MIEKIKSIETFVVSVERDTPYLGPVGPGESLNSKGYVVRRGNGTIYPSVDRSVLIKIETLSGITGWGETYGLCAPKATCEIVNDLLAPPLIGIKINDISSIWDSLYNLNRVRGYTGGFLLDAIAAIDISLWDICAKAAGVPLYKLLGGARRTKIPGYISGLPAAKIEDRAQMAQDWINRGFKAIKFHAVVSYEGLRKEAAILREAIGPEAALMVDLHWKFSADDAICAIQALEAFDVTFAEAPVKPEDLRGLAKVCKKVDIPIAVGEEWRTVYDAKHRLEGADISIVQPEMGHTGITQFMKISQLAHASGCNVAPHATIGFGFFLSASLHASAAANTIMFHEYQHSIMDQNAIYTDSELKCTKGAYAIPEGVGLGIEPNATLWKYAEKIT